MQCKYINTDEMTMKNNANENCIAVNHYVKEKQTSIVRLNKHFRYIEEVIHEQLSVTDYFKPRREKS